MEKASFLDRNISIQIKGIAAIMIMVGHVIKGAPWYLDIFRGGGQFWVGVFFFYSGYGLQYSLKHSTRYLDCFIINKIVKIFIPFLIAETFFTISYQTLYGEMNISDIILGSIGFRLYNSSLWYVVEIMALYIIFYFINRYTYVIGDKVIWIVLYIVFVLISIILDIGTWWYISTSAFLVGIFTEDFGKKVRNNRLLPGITCGTFAVLYLLRQMAARVDMNYLIVPTNYLLTALDLLLVPVFVLAIGLFVDSVQVRENPILKRIGNISYEIYLWHMFVYIWVSKFSGNWWLNAVLTIMITILLALGISYIRQYVMTSNL